MPITYDPNHRIFKLDAAGSTYALRIGAEGYLIHLYYGARIPDAAFDDEYTFRDHFASFSPSNPHLSSVCFSPDVDPLEYSGFNTGDFRPSAAAIRHASGDDAIDLRYAGHRLYAGKPALDGLPALFAGEDQAQTLEIDAEDKAAGIRVTLLYTVFEEESAMTRSVRVVNTSSRPAEIEKLMSLSFTLPVMDWDFVHLYGKWALERTVSRRALDHGTQSVSSRRGSSSHNHNPFAALAEHSATEDFGEVYGVNLVYSGNFLIEADVDFYGQTRINAGIHPDGFGWRLEPGEAFQSPEAVTVYTDGGLGEMSRIFHRLYRRHLIRGEWRDKKRPLLINSWEAAYFDFDADKLAEFARQAKELGIEMLVMDDGWFGRRNNDSCSLGDWQVNEDKLPGGLGALIERVNACGLKFGIWYEPEMISPDSDLFRQHPDWFLHIEGREPSIARSQYVLDMSRPEVRENIYAQMHAVLSRYPIDYVKWDFNRNLTEVGSAALPASRQKEVFHRFVLGTYELMNRITTDFPHLLLENCSGGGGRFDPGMLYYSPQIWASDNTDAIDRLGIQFGTSMAYPASTMGAHVSLNPRAGIETKGLVALWGTFGYELDPSHLTAADKELVRRQVQAYHKYYSLIHEGELYRVISPFDDRWRAAWEFVSPDKGEMLFTCVTVRRPPNPAYIQRFKGLCPEKYYREEETGRVYSGTFLMNAGLNLSEYPHEDHSGFSLHFAEVRDQNS